MAPRSTSAPCSAGELVVTLSGCADIFQAQRPIIAALKRLLGIEVDLSGFYRFAGSDKRLGPLAQRFRGFKPPRFLTLFEALVNGVTCQQLSLTGSESSC